ncbi:MAG: hypothetical protein QF380_09130, partial [Candidatus Marinimicrobia bacterium]|nr:hypothetical protein [Candidatus Neomarinimicrobiota bacterium]
SFLTTGWPKFKEKKILVTLFVTTSTISKQNKNYLNWDENKKIKYLISEMKKNRKSFKNFNFKNKENNENIKQFHNDTIIYFDETDKELGGIDKAKLDSKMIKKIIKYEINYLFYFFS